METGIGPRVCQKPKDSLPLVCMHLGSTLCVRGTAGAIDFGGIVVCGARKTVTERESSDPIKTGPCSVICFRALKSHGLRTTMPRILPRLIKALQRPPGPFEDELRIAPGLRSKARLKTRAVPPHKQHIPIRVLRPATEYSRSLLLDEESQVERRKGLLPVVKYQGQDGVKLMNEDELRWWSNPYRAHVSCVSVSG